VMRLGVQSKPFPSISGQDQSKSNGVDPLVGSGEAYKGATGIASGSLPSGHRGANAGDLFRRTSPSFLTTAYVFFLD
jgi:hypothetical protein